jgi:hypothetical protein
MDGGLTGATSRALPPSAPPLGTAVPRVWLRVCCAGPPVCGSLSRGAATAVLPPLLCKDSTAVLPICGSFPDAGDAALLLLPSVGSEGATSGGYPQGPGPGLTRVCVGRNQNRVDASTIPVRTCQVVLTQRSAAVVRIERKLEVCGDMLAY